jgi:hypothetical protein
VGFGSPVSPGQLDLIEHQEVSGAAVTTVTFSSLSGDSDCWYYVACRILMNGAAGDMEIRPNSISANQDRVTMTFDGTAGSHGGGADLRIAQPTASSVTFAEMLLCAASGLERGGVVLSVRETASGAGGVEDASVSAAIWNDLTTNVTTLVVNSQTASGIGIGSSFSLYRVAI